MPTALVTGASSGIGRAVATALTGRGWHVVAASRSEERLRPVVASLGGRARPLAFDLASLQSVRRAASHLLEEGVHVDVLVANAGVGLNRRGSTDDGFEARFGINHLGHFQLLSSLAPAMSPGSRVVTVASEAHRSATGIDFTRLTRSGGLVGFREYAVSKLANILFSREIRRRQPHLVTHAVHPGLVDTGIIPRAAKPLLKRRLLTAEQGADTVVWAAADLDAPGGGYYSERAELSPSPQALDDRLAAELWERSEAWTNASAAPPGDTG